MSDRLMQDLLAGLGGAQDDAGGLAQYQKDPVGFCKNVLGHTYPQQIQELFQAVLDHEVVVAKSCNAFGKSFGAADFAVFFAAVFPQAEVYITAAPPEKNLKRILWDKISGNVQGKDDVFGVCRFTGMTIRMGSSTIDGLTIPSHGQEHEREARFSGKHAPYLLFIIDEGDAVDDSVYKGIESCMSGGMARLLVMFNPRNKSGAAYRMIKNQDAKVIQFSAFAHPNVVSGEDIYPGAVDRERTARRINDWCRYLKDTDDYAGKDVFDLPDFFVGYIAKRKGGGKYPPLRAGRYRIENPAFSYMVLGEYPDQDESILIEESWIDAAIDRWYDYTSEVGLDNVSGGVDGIAGVDPGELGTDKSAICFRYGPYVSDYITWVGVDMGITNDRVETECKQAGVNNIVVDSNGFGAGVWPVLRKLGLNAIGIKTQISATEYCDEQEGAFNRMRDQLLWQLRLFLKNNPASMLPPDEELKEELLVLRFWSDKTSRRIRVTGKDEIKDKIKRSPNKTDSLALTFAPLKVEAGDIMNDARHKALKEKYCAPMRG